MSHNVTQCHTMSHNVTQCHTVSPPLSVWRGPSNRVSGLSTGTHTLFVAVIWAETAPLTGGWGWAFADDTFLLLYFFCIPPFPFLTMVVTLTVLVISLFFQFVVEELVD